MSYHGSESEENRGGDGLYRAITGWPRRRSSSSGASREELPVREVIWEWKGVAGVESEAQGDLYSATMVHHGRSSWVSMGMALAAEGGGLGLSVVLVGGSVGLREEREGAGRGRGGSRMSAESGGAWAALG